MTRGESVAEYLERNSVIAIIIVAATRRGYTGSSIFEGLWDEGLGSDSLREKQER